jgi:alpha-1,2-mannosyltransferase
MAWREGRACLRAWLTVTEERHARRTVREELTSAALAAAPAVALAYVLVIPAITHSFMPDFTVFWQAGRAALSGADPYPPAHVALLAKGESFVYPAPAAVAMAPLGSLPYPAAAAIWTVLLLASIPAALLLLGVRDWRCHGAALLTIWAVNGIFAGSVSPLLLLAVAALWRYRDRPIVSACLAAAIVCLKVYLWPVLVWMAVTGRRRAAAGAIALSAVLCVSSWAAIDFHGLAAYPGMLADLASGEQANSYSPLALLLGLGVGPWTARLLVGVGGAALLGLTALVIRRRGRLAELDSLTLCLVASLVLSPIVWPHYLLLLLVPVAIAHRRLSPPWLVAVASWVSPGAHSRSAAYVVVTLLVAGGTLLAMRTSRDTGDLLDAFIRLPKRDDETLEPSEVVQAGAAR